MIADHASKLIIFWLCFFLAACGGGDVIDPLSQSRQASDNAASAVFPASMVSDSYQTANAAGEPYLIRCAPNSNKIILSLHTWSADYTQVLQFPEYSGIERACIVSPNFNGPNNTPQALGSDDAIERINTVLQEVMYKTGLSRIYIVAASGGTIAAMNYMGKYPKKVHRASLWLPIHDLALLYSHTSDVTLKADMVSAIGHAPDTTADYDYFMRSPAYRLQFAEGPTTVFLNVGLSDTVSPPIHGQKAKEQLLRRNGFEVIYKEWPIGHVFGNQQRLDAVKQLVLE